jgi:hypothetical protein
VWILAAAGRLLGGGWSSAARSAAKIHGFLMFSGGGRCPLGKLNFGAPHWILGGWVVLQNKVCDHNHTTLANEQGPGPAHRSHTQKLAAWNWDTGWVGAPGRAPATGGATSTGLDIFPKGWGSEVLILRFRAGPRPPTTPPDYFITCLEAS